MARYLCAMAVMAVALAMAACGGSDDGGSDNGGANGDGGSQVSSERIHSRYLISEFEKDKDSADREFRDKFVTFEAFVDQHGANDDGTYVRLKSEPFATRFIYCYYDPAQRLDIPDLEFGSVVFMTGRVGDFEDIFLLMSECSTAQVDTEGGGTKSGSSHLDE